MVNSNSRGGKPRMDTKQTLLVVEETPEHLRQLIEILTNRDYTVNSFSDKALAISSAQAEPPDLILVDSMRSNVSGYDVCEKLKADERTRETPIIVIKTDHNMLDDVKVSSPGVVDYITRPFQVEEVLGKIETHLTISNLQKQLKMQNQTLSETLDLLKATQQQLILREKMATLGYLIAGIAHEISTPLSAIQASIDNMSNATVTSLQQLPQIFQQLSPERQADFLFLVRVALERKNDLSSREARQIKRQLKRELEAQGITEAGSLAKMLTNMGMYHEFLRFLPLLQEKNNVLIVQTAYNLFMQQSNSQSIKVAVERASKVVFALKNYAHYDESGQKLKANVIDGIEVVLILCHNQLKGGIDVVTTYEDVPFVDCYPDELNQVWTNMMNNAIHAMGSEGALAIDVARHDREVVVRITDSGHGIPQEILPRIFDPFFTTKPAGEGSGLGLDIVRKIIDRHQGRIDVESQPGRTTFSVFLPIEA